MTGTKDFFHAHIDQRPQREESKTLKRRMSSRKKMMTCRPNDCRPWNLYILGCIFSWHGKAGTERQLMLRVENITSYCGWLPRLKTWWKYCCVTMQQLFLRFLTIGIALLLSQQVSSEVCTIEGCRLCSTEIADWTTDDPDSPLSHELDNDTRKIYIYYYGQDITVNEGMLHHFNKLAELHLAGNFRAIRSNAFSKLLHLEKLTLNNVSLTKIED